MTTSIQRITTHDLRFQLEGGDGADAIHCNPQYSYAVTRLDAGDHQGMGLAFTLGDGNDWVCQAAEVLAQPLVGRDIEAVMADFGTFLRQLADHHQLRWLGPHKGLIHLALASVSNACFDLWAKARGEPLWKLLIDLSPEALVATLDLSYLEDTLTRNDALDLLHREAPSRNQRSGVIKRGYRGYDTSVGWFHYTDDEIARRARATVEAGFDALKLKVGSADPARDLRRAGLIREAVGDDVRLMLDVNQQWSVPQAIEMGARLAPINPFWIEEPTHPDDVSGHRLLARQIAPIPLAIGEHVPNRVVFKNYLQEEAAGYIQVDCVRVAGISEFLTVSLMARKFGVPVVPHVGDMGQIHQHLVLVNHIALGLPEIFLEYIPHLRPYFRHPAQVSSGVYHTPQEPGASSDFTDAAWHQAG